MTAINFGEVEARTELILSERRNPPGLESDIVRMFKEQCITGHFDDRIPMLCAEDTITYEFSVKAGRADIVIFHIDGSASVIEVKDGSNGYNHVVAGIGQAALYAVQFGMRRDILTRVRKCLLWTSTGDLYKDALIEMACIESKTIPLPWGHIKLHMAMEQAVKEIIAERARDGI